VLSWNGSYLNVAITTLITRFPLFATGTNIFDDFSPFALSSAQSAAGSGLGVRHGRCLRST
jgi:hypothetical protein